jgi:chorismate mutase
MCAVLYDIDDLHHEIDGLDATILAAVKRRTEISQAIGKVRMASGGIRMVHSREMTVIDRYSALGPEGQEQQLLADRARLEAATDLQDWAKEQLTPRDQEIAQLRDRIRRIEAHLSDLSEADQDLINEAVTVVRTTRQKVHLGFPAIQPPINDGSATDADH